MKAAEGDDLRVYLARHARGDWGVVDSADKRANDRDLSHRTPVFSAHILHDGCTKIWIITEADRSDDDPAAEGVWAARIQAGSAFVIA